MTKVEYDVRLRSPDEPDPALSQLPEALPERAGTTRWTGVRLTAKERADRWLFDEPDPEPQGGDKLELAPR